MRMVKYIMNLYDIYYQEMFIKGFIDREIQKENQFIEWHTQNELSNAR